MEEILRKEQFDREDLRLLLQSEGEEKRLLFSRAEQVKLSHVGNKVYFRGLIELSNLCEKDCLYCGIRKSNPNVERYYLSDEEVLHAATYAHRERYGSIVLQAGERTDHFFTERISRLLHEIKSLSNNTLGITLSLGEQSEETYREWFKAGAHRYLLRIESSNPDHYRLLHPDDGAHTFENRLNSIHLLRSCGYQVGTGVMIGTPFQTLDHSIDDLLFFVREGIDMVGMGPYIEHDDTPLQSTNPVLMPLTDRFQLTLKMIAALRIMMKDINIAATTALQAIDPLGREKAVKIGANIIMPNITPGKYRNNYLLYNNKPCTDEEPEQCGGCLDARIAMTDGEIGYGEWGDSIYFNRRKNKL